MDRPHGQQEFQKKAREAVLTLNREEACKLAERAVSELVGNDLVGLIEKGFSAGLSMVGDRFGKGEMFLPELIAAAGTVKEALKIIDPKLRDTQVKREGLGKIVLASVKGDIHDIGKSIVGSLLTVRGFEVIDLGVDVPTGEIVSSAKDVQAHIIGLSALLTTTLIAQKDVIDLLKEKGLREKYKVMIGGAAVSKDWATRIGADGYGADANEAVRLAVEFLQTKYRKE
jgi:trimethylamine corrinoid protein